MNLSVVIVCFLRFLWECYAIGAPLTSCFNDEFYEDEYHDVIEILYASIHRKFPANIVADSPVLRFPAELLTNAVGSFLFKVRCLCDVTMFEFDVKQIKLFSFFESQFKLRLGKNNNLNNVTSLFIH